MFFYIKVILEQTNSLILHFSGNAVGLISSILQNNNAVPLFPCLLHGSSTGDFLCGTYSIKL